jgi:hypothetical protein
VPEASERETAPQAAEQDDVPQGAERGRPRPGLDPDRAARAAANNKLGTVPPVIDIRPYRWAIGAFGIGLVVVISVALFLTHGTGTVGVPPGHRLHNFAAPVATSDLVGNANFAKPCRLGYLGGRAVNTCLLTRRSPLVLAFFVTGSSACVREVDAVQEVSRQFARAAVTFAAVAVHAARSQTARLVHQHHWTVPVAYDLDGVVGAAYSVAICPLLELAYRGGVVKYRLVGDRWLQPSALAAKVRALLR